MGNLDGQVAFITGAARGQGRAHAVKLASEGADIIAVDLCAPVATAGYDMATEADLAQTVALVEAQGRRIVASVADTRNLDCPEISGRRRSRETRPTGHRDRQRGNRGVGEIVLGPERRRVPRADGHQRHRRLVDDQGVDSAHHERQSRWIHCVDQLDGRASRRAGIAHYSASKHAVRGLAKSLANELGWADIRVNSVHPGNVRTTMIDNEPMVRAFRPDLENPVLADTAPIMSKLNLLPHPWVDPEVIADAVFYLVGPAGRGITGIALPIDLGTSEKFAGG